MADQIVEDKLKALVIKGNKIAAIKYYCDTMNVGIQEGKEEIERIEGIIYQDRVDQSKDIDPVLIGLLNEGKKIEAIKVYYDTTKCSLNEAKSYVETLSLTSNRERHLTTYEDDEQKVIDVFLGKGKSDAVRWYQDKYNISKEQAIEYVEETLSKSELDQSRRKPNFLNRLLIVLVIILIALLLNSLLS